MTDPPRFDPYVVLGVATDADAIVIQLAYRARIREVHPDLAGPAGLTETKRLNAAREWLLDPLRRAELDRARAERSRLHRAGPTASGPGWRPRPRPRPGSRTAPGAWGADAEAFDYGPRTRALRAFFATLRTLSRDERARVNHSLGDARPVDFEGYRDFLEPALRERSHALRHAIALVWAEGRDEPAPLVPPVGRLFGSGELVANAYAQWLLLGDFLRAELRDVATRSEHVVDAFAARCTAPWEAAVRQPRYGPFDAQVRAFFGAATTLPPDAAARLARSWQRHMRGDGSAPSGHLGPGIWLPAPSNVPEVLKVSGYLAAVDASRIPPPAGLAAEHHDGFRFGLRLTAHVLALGPVDTRAREYLRPWRDAVGATWISPGLSA